MYVWVCFVFQGICVPPRRDRFMVQGKREIFERDVQCLLLCDIVTFKKIGHGNQQYKWSERDYFFILDCLCLDLHGSFPRQYASKIL